MFNRNLCYLSLLGLPLMPAPGYAEAQDFVWLDRAMSAPPVPADEASTLFRELVLPEVSGKELAKQAQIFQARWKAHLAEREKMASSLTELATTFEKKEQFAKALALYEKVWEVFPEQQDLIGKIKRDRALGEVEIDLSRPQSAFTSLKRALLTYKLTAATFGLVEPSTVVYQPEIPLERDEMRQELQEAEERLKEAGEEVGNADLHDGPEPAAFQHSTMYLMFTELVDFHIEDASPAGALEKLGSLSSVPFVFTPAARAYVKKLSTGDHKGGAGVSINLKEVPVNEALSSLLKNCLPELKYGEGPFAAHIYHGKYDSPNTMFTHVTQGGPGVLSPDEMELRGSRTSDNSTGLAKLIAGSMLLPEIPSHWFIHLDDTSIEVLTGPMCLHHYVSHLVRFPGGARFYGRVLPLFRCLMPYPFPQRPGDRYDEPKERYLCRYQVDWQDYRMQRFLNDRISIVMLLRSKFVKAEQRAPNRYIPRLDVPERAIRLTSRLGLWFDGKAYRFLLFDSEEHRGRWLKSEDWHDMPGDINDYDWEAEKQQWLKRFEEPGVPEMPELIGNEAN